MMAKERTRAQEIPVTILLAVYNGAEHLPEQLASLAAQSHSNWQVVISDDGSKDASASILNGFAAQYAVTLIDGPRSGFNRNFLHLLQSLPEAPDMVALCDQDDVWLADKLEAAVVVLSDLSPDIPALYCSRRIIWNGIVGQGLTKRSRQYARAPGFANALVENIAPGNTIVLNPAAAALVRAAAPLAKEVYAYDWWIYQLVSGVGGYVHYDPEPRVLYRQHAGNVIGAGETVAGLLGNKIRVLRGTYTKRLNGQLAALKACEGLLTAQSRVQLDQFIAARSASVFQRLGKLRGAGVYRQGAVSDFMLRLAALLGRA